MLGGQMLLPQLCQRQCCPDRISNLPPVQLIGTEILSHVNKQGALFRVGDLQIFDEDCPDLSLLFTRKGVEAEGNVDTGHKGFVDVAGTVGG